MQYIITFLYQYQYLSVIIFDEIVLYRKVVKNMIQKQNTMSNNAKEDSRTIRSKRDLANALEELLQEKNYDDIGIKEITDKAMVSKNTFYNNFNEKT